MVVMIVICGVGNMIVGIVNLGRNYVGYFVDEVLYVLKVVVGEDGVFLFSIYVEDFFVFINLIGKSLL